MTVESFTWIWFIASLALAGGTLVYTYAWLVRRGAPVQYLRIGVPGYLSRSYSDWCAKQGLAPGWRLWLLTIAPVNLVASLVATAFLG